MMEVDRAHAPAIQGRERLWTAAFGLGFAAHFLHAFSLDLYLHLPGFLKELGASEAGIGLVFGMAGGTAVLSRPLLGRAMDARGRRGVIVLGGALAALVSALHLTAGSFGPWLFALRILHGLAQAMLFASLFAYAADVVPASRRIEGLAVFGVSGMLPMGLSGVAGDLILAHGGYRELFLVATASSVLAFGLSLPLRDRARPSGDPPRGLLAAIREPALLPLWAVGLAFATALAAPFAFLKTFVLATGIGSVGVFFAVYSAMAVALRLAFGRLPERLGPTRVLVASLGSMAAGLFALAAARSGAHVAAAGALCGLGHGYAFPILAGLVVSRARASERGAALAVFTALFDLGLLVGGPLLGGSIGAFGYRPTFSLAAAIVVLGALVAWRTRKLAERS